MAKNYFTHGIMVLSSLAILNSCQVASNSKTSQEPLANAQLKNSDAGKVSLGTFTNTQTDISLFNKLFEMGNTEEQIDARKKYLISITKPSENIYAYLADRKAKKEKGIRPAGYKKGIEEMADYRREITMPIGTDLMLYEEGYLMKEYRKAENSSILLRAERGRFAPAPNAATTYSLSNTIFTERGPNNIPGRDRSIVPSPTNPNKWYVGSVGGGVWITDDGGTSWRNTTDSKVPSLATSAVAISANNPNIVYVGTGEPFGNLDALNGVGLLKSTDGGETWTSLSNTINFGSVGRLLANPADANHLVVGTSKGIYVTKDGGASWSQTSTAGNAQDIKANNDFTALYASVNTKGIYKSIDGGTTWTIVFDVAAKKKNIKRMEIAVSPTDNNRLFLSAEEGTTTGMYLSDDAGVNFNELTYKASHSKEILGNQGWYDNTVAFNPIDKNVVYVGGVYVGKVTINPADNTYTVLQIASGYTAKLLNLYVHPDQHGLVCQISPTDPTKFRMLLTNDGGVYYTDYKTNPGETEKDWFGPVKNLNTNQLYGADKKKGEDLYAGGAQDNGSFGLKTGPGSKTSEYTTIWGGDGFEVLWNYKDTNKIIVGSQYNNFVRTVTGVGGTNYYGKNSDGGNSTESPFYSKLANANNNPDVIFTVAKRGVWRSPDFGVSWQAIPFNVTTNGSWFGNNSVATVKVSVADPNIVWAGSAVSNDAASSFKVNLSKDNGQTFAKTTGALPISGNYYISGLSASSIKPERAFVILSVAGQPKILKTNDFGATWSDITGFSNGVSTVGFPNVSVHSVLEMPFDENVIWAGTDIGVFETINGGASWYLIEKLPPVSIWSMKVVDDQVVLATHGRGIWTATIPELSTVQMPAYVAMPVIVSAAQVGFHDRNLKINTKYTDTKITSLKIYVDNALVGTIPGTVANQNYTFTTTSPLSQGIHTVGVSGVYDNGGATETPKALKNVEIIDFNSGAENINLATIAATDIYVPTDGKFVVDNVTGKFSYNVLNNANHPYLNSTVYQTYLKTPIIIGEKSKMDITQIVSTEAGYDFAIIEASKDLVNWKPIASFDEAKFANWTGVSAANIGESLFQTSLLDFTANNEFMKGDEVAVRLRLTTDPEENGYGWFIKSIVPSASLATNEVSVAENTVVIAPNPAKESTDLYLPQSVRGKVTIGIYDASGKMMSTVVKQAESKINLNLQGLNPGIYLVLVKGDNISKAVKLMKE